MGGTTQPRPLHPPGASCSDCSQADHAPLQSPQFLPLPSGLDHPTATAIRHPAPPLPISPSRPPRHRHLPVCAHGTALTPPPHHLWAVGMYRCGLLFCCWVLRFCRVHEACNVAEYSHPNLLAKMCQFCQFLGRLQDWDAEPIRNGQDQQCCSGLKVTVIISYLPNIAKHRQSQLNMRLDSACPHHDNQIPESRWQPACGCRVLIGFTRNIPHFTQAVTSSAVFFPVARLQHQAGRGAGGSSGQSAGAAREPGPEQFGASSSFEPDAATLSNGKGPKVRD